MYVHIHSYTCTHIYIFQIVEIADHKFKHKRNFRVLIFLEL